MCFLIYNIVTHLCTYRDTFQTKRLHSIDHHWFANLNSQLSSTHHNSHANSSQSSSLAYFSTCWQRIVCQSGQQVWTVARCQLRLLYIGKRELTLTSTGWIHLSLSDYTIARDIPDGKKVKFLTTLMSRPHLKLCDSEYIIFFLFFHVEQNYRFYKLKCLL